MKQVLRVCEVAVTASGENCNNVIMTS